MNFKRWIIKKLGGVPKGDIVPPVYTVTNLHPVKLCAEWRGRVPEDSDAAKRYTKKILCEEITRGLIRSGFVKVKRVDETDRKSVV